ncbi:MAG: ORF6N domain-containing protein [Campylobacterota bacterium]|nr:ORF6N domain-containing protein [Campylobacterota bacterium]
MKSIISTQIESKIFAIRNMQVMIDRDLAELYGVEPKRLNEQVKRNIQRFPDHFRFELTEDEKNELVANCDRFKMLKHSTSLPYAFTEQGVSMLSAVLRSPIAIEVSIKIMDSFVNMRKFLGSNSLIHEKFERIEQKLSIHHEQINKIFEAIESKDVKPKQGIFYNGQIFDAYVFISDLIKKAEKSIILIDNYIDESTLLHLSSKVNKDVKITILTKTVTKAIKLDIEKNNAQYPNIEVKAFKDSHDRFIIIDEEIYHIGASLKDLGKKWFAFSLLESSSLGLMSKIETMISSKGEK